MGHCLAWLFESRPGSTRKKWTQRKASGILENLRYHPALRWGVLKSERDLVAGEALAFASRDAFEPIFPCWIGDHETLDSCVLA